MKMIRPRVARGLTLQIFCFYLGASLTVLNPDFTRVIQKSLSFQRGVGVIQVHTCSKERETGGDLTKVQKFGRILSCFGFDIFRGKGGRGLTKIVCFNLVASLFPGKTPLAKTKLTVKNLSGLC